MLIIATHNTHHLLPTKTPRFRKSGAVGRVFQSLDRARVGEVAGKEAGKFRVGEVTGKEAGKFRVGEVAGKEAGKFRVGEVTGKEAGKFRVGEVAGKEAGKFRVGEVATTKTTTRTQAECSGVMTGKAAQPRFSKKNVA